MKQKTIDSWKAFEAELSSDIERDKVLAKNAEFIYEGCIGFDKSKLTTTQLNRMRRELVLVPTVFKGDPEPAVLFEEDATHIWVPRHYPENAATPLPTIDHLRQVATGAMVVSFDVKTTLQESRGQVTAVENMTSYILANHAGVLQAYTGCGKTIMGYTIAANFGRAIGVFVYNNHMMRNWIETAQLVFGLKEEDIGVVQGDRCDLGKAVTVMMVQSLYSREYPDALYDQMGFLLADEVNRFAAPVWQGTISMFGAPFRMGMSADPSRKDGLDDVVTWNFGRVAHKVPEKKKKALPLVCQVQIQKSYPRSKYIQHWGEWRGFPDTMKYRKLISQDRARDAVMVEEMLNARISGRKALVFTQYRDHVERLKDLFEMSVALESKVPVTSTSALMGGLKKKELKPAMEADFIFTTYAFSRDALNLPHIDTVFFCTPCGDPLQAIGRLRDTGPEKKSLLGVDFYEDTAYSREQAAKRAVKFRGLGLKIHHAKRSV